MEQCFATASLERVQYLDLDMADETPMLVGVHDLLDNSLGGGAVTESSTPAGSGHALGSDQEQDASGRIARQDFASKIWCQHAHTGSFHQEILCVALGNDQFAFPSGADYSRMSGSSMGAQDGCHAMLWGAI